MQRREAVKLSAVSLGLSSAFVSGFMTGCQPSGMSGDYQPIFLDQSKYQYLTKIAELLIPQTDTPGAAELGLSEWIDTIIGKCYTPENQKEFSTALTNLHGSVENPTKPEDLLAIDAGSNERIKEAYTSVKKVIATAYHCNEYVGTKLLNYDPVPGEYEPCIELNSVKGKAWTDG